MTQRALSIALEEQADGSKRRSQRVFDAAGFAGLSVNDAGAGFLAIVAQLHQELAQGAAPAPTPEPPPPPKPPQAKPKDSDPNPTFRKPKLKDYKKPVDKPVQEGV